MIVLNVGGTLFYTNYETLHGSNSYFQGLVQCEPSPEPIFVDRDPTHFRHVLNWMRGVRYIPQNRAVCAELLWEAQYYSLADMSSAIEHVMRLLPTPS